MTPTGPPPPTLPGQNMPPDAPPDDAGESPEDALKAAAQAIVHLEIVGTSVRVTFADGQELMLTPGDAHEIHAVDTNTTVGMGDGQGPRNLSEQARQGNLPDWLHGILGKPEAPTAADAGMIQQPPPPTLPGLNQLPQAA